MYYLQSRYYDPQICRFINADALVSTGQGLLGNNMFAYCLNNPICYSDNGGTSVTATVIGGAVAGAVISLTSYLVNSGISESEITLDGVFGAIIAGAISGGFGGMAGFVSAFNSQMYYSALAAISAGMYTAMTGGDWFLTLLISFGGTFLGSWINTSDAEAFAEAFATFAAGLFVGTPTEILSSTAQIISDPENTAPESPTQGRHTIVPTRGIGASVSGRSGGSGTGQLYAICYA